jgi:hypothetical protein
MKIKKINLKQKMEEAFRKPPSKFFLYSQSKEGQIELKGLIDSLNKTYKNKNKEALIEILANTKLETFFRKKSTSIGAKTKHAPYQKYYQMVREVYSEVLSKKNNFEEIISIKNLHKALDEKYPNIYWKNNKIEITKEKIRDGKLVVNISQMHRTIASEHKFFLISESASINI